MRNVDADAALPPLRAYDDCDVGACDAVPRSSPPRLRDGDADESPCAPSSCANPSLQRERDLRGPGATRALRDDAYGAAVLP